MTRTDSSHTRINYRYRMTSSSFVLSITKRAKVGPSPDLFSRNPSRATEDRGAYVGPGTCLLVNQLHAADQYILQSVRVAAPLGSRRWSRIKGYCYARWPLTLHLLTTSFLSLSCLLSPLPLCRRLSSSSRLPSSVVASADSLLVLRSDALATSVRLRTVHLRVVWCLTILLGTAVEVFERRDFDVEVGASISCAANGRSRARLLYLALVFTCLPLSKVHNGSGNGKSISH
jgi:hypothetical protein